MFENFSPEAQQIHTHNHATYTYTTSINEIGITNDGMWRVSEAVSNPKFQYCVPAEIEKLDHTKETISTDNLRVIEDKGVVKLVNDRDECVEICNAQETERKVSKMIDKASNLPANTPIDRAFRKQLSEFLKECGF